MNFFRKCCYCLCDKGGSIPLVEEGEDKLDTGIKSKGVNANDEDLFPQKLYRPDEINVIKYVYIYINYFIVPKKYYFINRKRI